MAEIEDVDFWFTEFKEEMINLLQNFSEELTVRFQQIYTDVIKLNEKLDRTFDEIHKIHEQTHQEILATIHSLVHRNL